MEGETHPGDFLGWLAIDSVRAGTPRSHVMSTSSHRTVFARLSAALSSLMGYTRSIREELGGRLL